jgi:Putative Holin-like Toxin (Hol-Tox)
MNHPAVCVAIVAAAIAFGSLIVAIIGLVIAAKSYKKSKRLEFFQRRDQLFAKISDLNAKNSEAHLISARYEIVAIVKASLGLRGEQAEENTAVVVRIFHIAQ